MRRWCWVVMLVLIPRLALAERRINAVIGDAGIAGISITAGEDDRIAAHLAYVEAALRRAEVTAFDPVQRRARTRNLDRLSRYREARQFPRNTYQPDRVPVFVDATGRRCAVAALAEADLGAVEIEAIAEADRLAYLGDIRSPDLARWAARSGLTLRELAMIQPTYHFQQRDIDHRALGERAILAAAEACAIEAYPKTITPLPPAGSWLNATLVLTEEGASSIKLDPVTPIDGVKPPSWTAAELEACLGRKLRLMIPPLALTAPKQVSVSFQTFPVTTAEPGQGLEILLAQHVAATRLAPWFTKCGGKAPIALSIDVDQGKVTVGKASTAPARCVAKHLDAIRFPPAAATHLELEIRRESHVAGVQRAVRIEIARMLARARDNALNDPDAGGE